MVYMASFKYPGLSFDFKIQPIFDSHRRSNEDEYSSQVPGVVCNVIVQKERDAMGCQASKHISA